MSARGALTAAGMAAIVVAICLLGCFVKSTVDANPRPDPSEEQAAPNAQTQEDGFPHVDWDHWRSVNPDVIAWVTVPGTTIDYPILQADPDDPTYYLHHDVYGHESVYGVPYVDASCPEGLLSPHVVIYGHHLRLGGMFSDFANMTDQAYLDDHPVVLLQTPTATMALAIEGARVVSADKEQAVTLFSTTEAFLDWRAKELAACDTVTKAQPLTTRVYTFVTCSYSRWENERTLTHAGIVSLQEKTGPTPLGQDPSIGEEGEVG